MSKYIKKHSDTLFRNSFSQKIPVKKKTELFSWKIKFPNILDLKLNTSMFSLFSHVRFSIRKQTFFAKRLAFLIRSGVSMLESMHLIQKQAKSQSDIRVFNKIIFDISNGQSLAVSLGKFKGVFGNFAINIIRAGEHSGTLMQNLNYLADELKKKDMLRRKIMGSLLYPLIITLATFAITGFLTLYIFPKILPIFESLHAALPLSTRIMIGLVDILKNYGLYIFFVFIFSIIGLVVSVRHLPWARFVYDGFILKIPLVGSIAQHYNLTNIMRTLGLLLKSGISLTEALLITADTTDNTQYKKSFEKISEGVMRGKGMSDMIAARPSLFPEMLVHMISIGERSGNLSPTLIYLSEYYENEFDELTKNLSSSIEPALMVVMGVIVGFVAISVITPIYAITSNIHK